MEVLLAGWVRDVKGALGVKGGEQRSSASKSAGVDYRLHMRTYCALIVLEVAYFCLAAAELLVSYGCGEEIVVLRACAAGVTAAGCVLAARTRRMMSGSGEARGLGETEKEKEGENWGLRGGSRVESRVGQSIWK
jgi:hypothetical protein